MKTLVFALNFLLLASLVVKPAEDYLGYARHQVSGRADGRSFTVVVPRQAATGRPWIWCGAFWGNKDIPATRQVAAANVKLLGKGFHMVCSSPPSVYGYVDGNRSMDDVYADAVAKYGLSPKPVLVALSREALFMYRWAAANPDKVAGLYVDNGVCDFKSWPGGMGKAKRDDASWRLVLESYGFNSEAEALAYDQNPIDLLKPLADARIPILHVCGTADAVVPYEENAAIIRERYERMGGPIEVILKPGAGHHPHGLEDPAPIIEFMQNATQVSRSGDRKGL
jgi:pimeloyl-ACP methyl ester carboxylesterase